MTIHRNETYQKNKSMNAASERQIKISHTIKPISAARIKEHTNHTQRNRKYFSDQSKNPIRNTK